MRIAKKDEQAFWLDWLNRYKSFTCLWEEQAKRKASPEIRAAAYRELGDLMEQAGIVEKASKQMVARRINTFRTGYRRESRRIQEAKKKGLSDYGTTLFYYKSLSFLDDAPDMSFYDKDETESEEENDPICCSPIQTIEEKRKTYDFSSLGPDRTSAMKKKLDDCLENKSITFKNTSNDEVHSSMPSKKLKINGGDLRPISKPESKSDQHFLEIERNNSLHYGGFTSKNDFNRKTIAPPLNEVDEYEILGKRIAAHFRNMTNNQSLLAEKIINDVCIYGRMEKLTWDSVFYVNPTNNDETNELEDDESSHKIDYDSSDNYIIEDN